MEMDAEHKAEECRAGVAHEDLCRVEIIRDEAQRTRRRCAASRMADVVIRHEQRHDEHGAGRDRGHAGSKAVETVDEVHGVRDGHDPDNRDRHGEPGKATYARPREPGLEKYSIRQPCRHGDDGRNNLHDKFRQGIERHDIVQNAEHDDDRRTEQDAAAAARSMPGKAQHRDTGTRRRWPDRPCAGWGSCACGARPSARPSRRRVCASRLTSGVTTKASAAASSMSDSRTMTMTIRIVIIMFCSPVSAPRSRPFYKPCAASFRQHRPPSARRSSQTLCR